VTRTRVLTLVLGVMAPALAGCFSPSTYDCDVDSQCGSGEVCARTHECLTAGEVRAVRVRWTIDGQADAAAECAALGIGDLTIGFSSSDGAEVSFAPVPCGGGLYFIDKLPTRFDQVELYGYDANGVRYYGVTILGSDPEYTVSMSGS